LNRLLVILTVFLFVSILGNFILFSSYFEKYSMEEISQKIISKDEMSYLKLPSFPEVYDYNDNLQLSFDKNVKDKSDFTSWKNEIQMKFLELYEFPEILDYTDYKIFNISEYEKDEYNIKKYSTNAIDDDKIIFYELYPKNAKNITPCQKEICIPAVLIIPASGNQGSADVMNSPSELSKYYFQSGIGEKITEMGYIVYVIENRGWGERKIDPGFNCKEPDIYCSGKILDRHLHNLGYNLKTLQTLDALQVLQIMKEAEYVDDENISVVGLSLGGDIAQYLSILDNDIKNIAIASGLQSTYLTSGTAITPKILQYYDDSDLISSIAPKSLYLSWGLNEDSMFGYEANSLYSATKIKNAYSLHDKEQNLTIVTHDLEENDGHVYDVRSLLEFLEQGTD
tara:strand:- start:119 stop:1309 length:1191 start_codon:yes stop_codon:yes gene_type:complete